MRNILSRSVLARAAGYTLALLVLTGCDRLKEMLTKNADAGSDAAVVVVVDASAPEDAGPADAGVLVLKNDDELPAPDGDEVKANRDIGFGNYKDELDKIEKEADTAAKKK